MTNLTKEEMQRIVDGAPEGAICYGIINPNQVFYSDGIIGCCNTIWIENYDDGGYLEVEEDDLCIYGFDEFRVLSDLRKILAQQQEIERLRNPWVSVEDNLPAYGKTVLLMVNGVVQEVTFIRDGSDDSNDWFEPAHYDDPENGLFITVGKDIKWIPLPQPPKGESDE